MSGLSEIPIIIYCVTSTRILKGLAKHGTGVGVHLRMEFHMSGTEKAPRFIYKVPQDTFLAGFPTWKVFLGAQAPTLVRAPPFDAGSALYISPL